MAVSGRTPDVRLSETAGIWRREKTGPATHAADGPGARLSETANQYTPPGTQTLSVSFTGFAHHTRQPGLVRGHNVHSHAQGLFVPGGGDGLAQPESAVLAAFQHHGHGFLRHGLGRGLGEIRQARYLQHRPGQPVYQLCFYQRLAGERHSHIHGRARPMAGQRVHRTALALAQVRERVPERLRNRLRGQSGHWQMD